MSNESRWQQNHSDSELGDETTVDVNQSPTCFVGGDGELVARVAVADDVLGHHADVVGRGGVEVDDGGLVELR